MLPKKAQKHDIAAFVLRGRKDEIGEIDAQWLVGERRHERVGTGFLGSWNERRLYDRIREVVGIHACLCLCLA